MARLQPEWVRVAMRTAWAVIETVMECCPARSQAAGQGKSTISMTARSAHNGHGLTVLSLTVCCAFKRTSPVKKNLELLLPSSAQGAVELYQRESFIQHSLRQVQPRGEIARIAVEHFEITGRAAGVARI